MEMAQAVDLAIEECIREGILGEFLEKHRAEAREVSIFEYDEERQRAEIREDGIEYGLKQGEYLNRIRLIMKKAQKGLNQATISEHLEEPEEFVGLVCALVRENPALDVAGICKLLETDQDDTNE